jgi:hypothetical protein
VPGSRSKRGSYLLYVLLEVLHLLLCHLQALVLVGVKRGYTLYLAARHQIAVKIVQVPVVPEHGHEGCQLFQRLRPLPGGKVGSPEAGDESVLFIRVSFATQKVVLKVSSILAEIMS